MTLTVIICVTFFFSLLLDLLADFIEKFYSDNFTALSNYQWMHDVRCEEKHID